MERYTIVLYHSEDACSMLTWEVARKDHISAIASAIYQLKRHQRLVSGDVEPCDKWRVVFKPPHMLPKNIAVGNATSVTMDYEYLCHEPSGT